MEQLYLQLQPTKLVMILYIIFNYWLNKLLIYIIHSNVLFRNFAFIYGREHSIMEK